MLSNEFFAIEIMTLDLTSDAMFRYGVAYLLLRLEKSTCHG